MVAFAFSCVAGDLPFTPYWALKTALKIVCIEVMACDSALGKRLECVETSLSELEK
jgi:hypothetical protein